MTTWLTYSVVISIVVICALSPILLMTTTTPDGDDQATLEQQLSLPATAVDNLGLDARLGEQQWIRWRSAADRPAEESMEQKEQHKCTRPVDGAATGEQRRCFVFCQLVSVNSSLTVDGVTDVATFESAEWPFAVVSVDVGATWRSEGDAACNEMSADEWASIRDGLALKVNSNGDSTHIIEATSNSRGERCMVSRAYDPTSMDAWTVAPMPADLAEQKLDVVLYAWDGSQQQLAVWTATALDEQPFVARSTHFLTANGPVFTDFKLPSIPALPADSVIGVKLTDPKMKGLQTPKSSVCLISSGA